MPENSNSGNTNSGNTDTDGGGSNGSNGQTDFGAFTGGLQQDNRQWIETKGWKSADDLIKSHRELETKFSSRGAQHRLGDYAFAAPANAKDIGYDGSFAETFKAVVQKHNIDPQAAAAIHDWFSTYAGEQIKAAGTKRAEMLDTAVATAERELTKTWGDQNNPSFKRQHELALRAMRQLGIDGEKIGILAKHGDKSKVVDHATFAALSKVGASMYSEDSLHGESAAGVNPFDPKTTDTRAQNILVTSDPDKAEQLIRTLSKEDQAMWLHFLSKQEMARRNRR